MTKITGRYQNLRLHSGVYGDGNDVETSDNNKGKEEGRELLPW